MSFTTRTTVPSAGANTGWPKQKNCSFVEASPSKGMPVLQQNKIHRKLLVVSGLIDIIKQAVPAFEHEPLAGEGKPQLGVSM